MATIAPSSEIKLYSNIQITGGMNIAFSTRAAQTAYFNRHVVQHHTNCYYVRKTGTLKVEARPSIVNSCNFISFRNPAFLDKTIYARIVDWEYINNETTEIRYAIDWWQTYMFDCRYLRGQIEREHLSQDDFVKAESNPYDLSIYEFNTSEALPTGESLEPNYTLGTNLDTIGPNGSPWVVIQVSSFDTEIVPLNPLVGLSSAVFTPNNEVIIGGVTRELKLKLPHAYYTFVTQENRMHPILDYLTKQGLTMEIIGIYMINSDIITSYLEINGNDVPKSSMYKIKSNWLKTGYRNKKLCRHPFQYIRVVTPANEIKEYQIERFMSDRLLYMALCLDGVNMISILPYGYKEFKNNGGNLENLNYGERIDFNNIGQVGFATDAYLAFQSNQYAKTLQERTVSKAAALTGHGLGMSTYDYAHPKYGEHLSVADLFGRGTAMAVQMASTMLPDFVNNLPVVGDVVKSLGAPGFDETIKQDFAETYRTSDNNDADPYQIYKDAYAADEYHAGDSNGMIDSYFALNGGKLYQFQVFYVSLLPDIMNKYDNYFSYYGYNSQRVGVPRILNYVTQSGSQPHFDDLDGLVKTYVKTSGIRITNVPENVSGYIENIFNSGCLFLKGENLQ